MKTINSPHDRFFRASMSDPRVARDFFECHLPDKLRSLVNLDILQLRKESYVSEELQLAITDMLFSTEIKEQSTYLYLLVEHQSSADVLMPFRLLKYIVAIMNQHLKETKATTLPIVYPMVYYHGSQAYIHSTDLFDLFGNFSDLARSILLQPFHLIDLNLIPDQQIKEYLWLGIMELTLKRIFENDLRAWIYDLLELLRQVEKKNGEDYITTTLRYLMSTDEALDHQTFINIIQTNMSSEMGENVMTIAEQLRAEGWTKGISKGRVEGRVEGRTEGEIHTKQNIARNLLQLGFSLDLINRVTSLSLKEIQALEETIF